MDDGRKTFGFHICLVKSILIFLRAYAYDATIPVNTRQLRTKALSLSSSQISDIIAFFAIYSTLAPNIRDLTSKFAFNINFPLTNLLISALHGREFDSCNMTRLHCEF
jgi:hypothetical protein